MSVISLVQHILQPGLFRQPTPQSVGAKGARIEFIDLAKGICILLVVLLHSNALGSDIPNFKAVRMPLYFILSGLFFREYGKAATFVMKKVNRMVVPFVVFIFVHIGVVYLFQAFAPGEDIDLRRLYLPFTERQYVNTPVWFLICLFEINVLFLGVYCLAHGKKKLLLPLCLLSGLIGYFFSLVELKLPLHLDTAFTALPFFCAGRLLGSTKLFFPNRYDLLSLPGGLVLIGISFGIYTLCGAQEIDFINNVYTGHIAVIYANSLIFTIGVMLVCKGIGHMPLLSYMGRYSIIVLCLHYIYIYIACRVFLPEGFKEPEGLLPFLVAFPLSVASIPLCRRFIPKLTAQKDLF